MSATLITRQLNADSTAARWKAKYVDKTTRYVGDAKAVHAQLVALGPTPNPDDVDRIIGNTSWTRVGLVCNGCGEESDRIVQVGEEPDYESRTARLCAKCLDEAVRTMREGN